MGKRHRKEIGEILTKTRSAEYALTRNIFTKQNILDKT